MTKLCLLSCPDTNMKYNERVMTLKENISIWLHSDAFVELVKLSGGNVKETGSIKEIISYYNKFSEIWDYRKMKANGGERWMIQEDAFLSDHRTIIMDCVTLLGLRDVVEPSRQPEYVLPLGGARLANLDRCITANNVCSKYPVNEVSVVALTGMRPINDIERPFLEQYAPDAQTEYEAMCCGMSKAFNLSKDAYEEKVYEHENLNLAWAERHYCGNQRRICVLSAPSVASQSFL